MNYVGYLVQVIINHRSTYLVEKMVQRILAYSLLLLYTLL